MRTLVVYESLFGNTHHIAQASQHTTSTTAAGS